MSSIPLSVGGVTRANRSERENKAMAYSAKCERRQIRQAKRRDARIKRTFSFAVGFFTMACILASLI